MTNARLHPITRSLLSRPGVLLAILALFQGGILPAAAAPTGRLLAWGDNYSGQLGTGPTGISAVPVETLPDGVTALAAGSEYSLAVKQDGTVWASGSNFHGNLGDGTTTNRTIWVQVAGPGGAGFLSGVLDVSAGYYNSLALKQDGTVWAWGGNPYGNLGDGTSLSSYTPVQVVGPAGVGFFTGATAVSIGVEQSLAVKQDGTVWTWGGNDDGELGDGTTNRRNVPGQVVGPGGAGYLTGVIAVGGGSYHSLALKQDGTVWAWGGNYFGELGDGTITGSRTPVQVVGPDGIGFLTGVVAISAGSNDNLALRQDGTVWAWGRNDSGELGDGTTSNRDRPVQVVGPGGVGFLTGVTAISAGGDLAHSLALKQGGALWSWGYNSYGQLGDGTFTDEHTPVQAKGPGGVGFLQHVATFAAGDEHSLAILSNPFDFNGDGQADLLWQNASTGGVTAWFMNGVQFSGTGASIVDSASWKIVGVADFNGDGSPDLVWQNPANGAVYVWYMNGPVYSGAGGSIVAATDPAWRVVGTPDLNNDGHPDILWQNSNTGAVVYWLMNGTQYTGQSGTIAASVDPAWKIVGTPDLDSDGQPDLLWQNSTTGGVYVWYMNGVTYSGTGSYIVASADPSWKVVGTPDLNQDGLPDLLWQNSTTGGVLYWLMNGAQYTGQGGYIVTSTDLNWQIVGIH